MQPTNNASAKIISSLIIGLIIGFAAGAFWQARRLAVPAVPEGDKESMAVTDADKNMKAEETGGEKTSMKDEKTNANGTSTMAAVAVVTSAAGSQTITVMDQPGGGVALIAGVTTDEPVWVAVRETRDGGLGNILGAQKIFGNTTGVLVDLLRPTKAGANYVVVLYRDIGAPAFNYREDVLIEGVEGRFTAK